MTVHIRQEVAACGFSSVKDPDEAMRTHSVCSVGKEATIKAGYMKDNFSVETMSTDELHKGYRKYKTPYEERSKYVDLPRFKYKLWIGCDFLQ